MARACEACHARKVKCLQPAGEVGSRCLSCASNGLECRPHVRKRKQDPQPRSRDDGIFIVPTSAENRAQIEGDGQHLSVHQASANPTPTSIAASPQSAPHSSFLGRSGYITSNDLAIDEDDAMRYEPPPPRTEGTLAELQSSMLQSIFAICLPPSSVRLSLIKSFLDRGRLWMPIVDPDDLGRLASETPGSLLLTAVFVAGSKLSAAPNALEWGEKCYFHAKSLLFWGSGHDTLQSITGSILLHWWNPSGPEHVSLDSSTLWLRISVGLALQAGLHREPDPGQPDGCLRRRLWWTLVARDNQISTSHGRPRALRAEDSNVRPLQLDDFAGTNEVDGLLFIHFVRITSILGDITEHYRCGSFSERHRLSVELELLRWINELPPVFSLYDKSSGGLSPYDFRSRQLYVPFFVALIIFYRSDTPGQQFSLTSLLASSFVSGIFEEYISWGDILFLAPASIFYLLVASLIQVSSYRHYHLSQNKEKEISTVRMSLKELRRRFPTAYGAERIFENLLGRSDSRGPTSQKFSRALSPVQKQLFAPFGPDLCASWHLLSNGMGGSETRYDPPAMTEGLLHERHAALYNVIGSSNTADGVEFDPRLGSQVDASIAASTFPLVQPLDNLASYTLGGFDFWWPEWTELNC